MSQEAAGGDGVGAALGRLFDEIDATDVVHCRWLQHGQGDEKDDEEGAPAKKLVKAVSFAWQCIECQIDDVAARCQACRGCMACGICCCLPVIYE